MPQATTGRIGLRDLVIAKLLTDTANGVTYDDVAALPGAIDMQVTSNEGDPVIIESDDSEEGRIYQDPDKRIALELSKLTMAQRAMIYGHTVDSNGVMLMKAGDTPPYVAIGGKSIDRNGVDTYFWFLKAIVRPASWTAHIKQKGNITSQSEKVEFDCIKRTYDGEYGHMVKADETAFASEKAAFFDAPYVSDPVPAITISAQPVDTAVTEGAISGSLSVTASVTGGGSVTYQWYQNDERSADGAVAVSGATSASLTIPTGLADGNHYFYCVCSSAGAVSVTSDIVVVVVLAA